MRGWLTDERKSLIVGVFTASAAGACGVALVLWALAALVVGSADLAAWIGGGLS